jgi:antitoxin MazE
MITTKMQKWGNSYGVRIPKIILDQMDLPLNTRFEVRIENGAIMLTPAHNINIDRVQGNRESPSS